MNEKEERAMRIQRLVYDQITDKMLTTPVGDLTDAETAMIAAVLRGPYADDLMVRLDRIGVTR